jgi:hypothetical protein
MRGTADYVLVDSHTRTLVVLDWKTGFASTYDIAGHGQLRTLSLMALQRFVLKHFQPKWRVILAIGEARQGCTAQIVAEEVPVSMLTEEHLNNLVAAQERVGLGFLRPGEVQCQWCPARGICPVEAGKTTTQTKAIVLAAGGLLKKVRKSEEGITASNAGQLHQVVQGLRKLTDQCQSSIKDLVRTSGIITRPDGKVLVIKSHPVETLSKESIRRGLGAERAKALLEELRGMGAMEVSEREVLVAVDNE